MLQTIACRHRTNLFDSARALTATFGFSIKSTLSTPRKRRKVEIEKPTTFAKPSIITESVSHVAAESTIPEPSSAVAVVQPSNETKATPKRKKPARRKAIVLKKRPRKTKTVAAADTTSKDIAQVKLPDQEHHREVQARDESGIQDPTWNEDADFKFRTRTKKRKLAIENAAAVVPTDHEDAVTAKTQVGERICTVGKRKNDVPSEDELVVMNKTSRKGPRKSNVADTGARKASSLDTSTRKEAAGHRSGGRKEKAEVDPQSKTLLNAKTEAEQVTGRKTRRRLREPLSDRDINTQTEPVLVDAQSLVKESQVVKGKKRRVQLLFSSP